MIYASDSTLEDTVSLHLSQRRMHYSEEGQRYVCHFQLDPVSIQAARLTPVTHIYTDEKKTKRNFMSHYAGFEFLLTLISLPQPKRVKFERK